MYNPYQIGIRHIRIAFPHTFGMRIIKKPLELGKNNPIFSGQNVYANAFLYFTPIGRDSDQPIASASTSV